MIKRSFLKIALCCLVLAAPAAMTAYAGINQVAVADDDATYTIILKEVGPNKVKVVKIVREFLDVELKEAFGLVNSLPAVIKEKVSAKDAEHLRQLLEAEGATVELAPTVAEEAAEA